MEEAFSEIFKLFCPFTCIPASRHSLNHWMNLSSPEKEKRVRVDRTFSVFFQRTAMSMGATMAARVEAIGHTLPRVQAFLCPTALLALFGKCINKTHPGLSLLVLWVSRLVWIVGYWGRDTLTEHINYSSGLPGPSEEKRKGKQHCNMNGYEGGRYLYYRKYSVQSACPCLLLPEVGSSRSGLKDPK